jgi:hypothetical protein
MSEMDTIRKHLESGLDPEFLPSEKRKPLIVLPSEEETQKFSYNEWDTVLTRVNRVTDTSLIREKTDITTEQHNNLVALCATALTKDYPWYKRVWFKLCDVGDYVKSKFSK